MDAWEILFLFLAGLLLVPVLVFSAEVVIAALPGKIPRAPLGHRRRLAVLMPAHDEELVIGDAIRAVLLQLTSADRLLVVADNCADATAAVSAAEGAEVVIRSDTSKRGKGYALDFGIRHLRNDPPALVIIIDADCRVGDGAIDRLARVCDGSHRPVQALYTMHAGPQAGLKLRFAEFAWVVKNKIRPSGLRRLRLPCHLMGTGMAFSWAHLSSADLATGHIVEDVKYGLDFARAGVAPLLCPEASVSSTFPLSVDGVRSQRTRWEHGHIGMILSDAPRLLMESIRTRNGDLLALTLDLCVPPLALLSALVALVWIATAAYWAATDAASPVCVSSLALALLAISVGLAWLRAGRHILSLGDLMLAPLYPLAKLPIYVKFFFARQVDWVRSRRERD